MPRCSSLPASAETSGTHLRFLEESVSIPGLPDDRSCPRLAAVAPSHGGSSGHVWSPVSTTVSVPPIISPGHSHSAAEEQRTVLSSGDAWLELQREMGSLKADNRMVLHGNRGGSGGGQEISAHPLRISGPAESEMSKSLAEISTVCAEATTDLLAKTLSLRLDNPLPMWDGGKSGETPPSPSLTRKIGRLNNNLMAKPIIRFRLCCVRPHV